MSRQLQITPQSCKSVAPSSHLCTFSVYCFCIKAFLSPFGACGSGSCSSAGRPGQAGPAVQPSCPLGARGAALGAALPAGVLPGDAPPAPGLTSPLPELEVSWEPCELQTAFFH